MGAKLYGVYTAKFPFIGEDGNKIRPVVVVSEPRGAYGILAIIPVSSRAAREDVDVLLSDWKTEGLIKESVARVHRLTTMLQSDLTAELGVLTAADSQSIRESLGKLLKI